MKKLIMISALAICCCSAFIPATSFAQGSKMMDKKMKDGCVMMKDNKMMVMKGGKWMAMDKEMTMTNGTKVMTNGTVMMKDGKKMMMKNGECMKPDGMMDKKM
jgi:hypothetical protein